MIGILPWPDLLHLLELHLVKISKEKLLLIVMKNIHTGLVRFNRQQYVNY